MPTGCLPALLPAPTMFTKTMSATRSPYNYSQSHPRRSVEHSSVRCKASSSSSSSSSSPPYYTSVADFDLYDLLGIDCSSNQSQIKTAYRTLQKRCHPDIAGPPGHDMAIILNEAYKILSDPSSRSAYDKGLAKLSELRGYTGKTLYSAWFGSESEQRAVFVDEVKCIGCLKCALLAEKTFAIESVYGRARVVGQWADPENKIQAAIDACPVDCISMVDRSDLAALEFLMSKQPRGNVRVGGGNSAGARVANIFVDVKKFQSAYANNIDKANTRNSEETDLQRKARMSAIQAIRSIANWLDWQSPIAGAGISGTLQNMPQDAQRPEEPNIKKLREAAAAWKQASENPRSKRRNSSSSMLEEDYWAPSTPALSAPIKASSTDKETKRSTGSEQNSQREVRRVRENNRQNPARLGFPLVTGTFAAIVVRLHAGSTAPAGGITQHIGGSLLLDVVNSYWLQAALAGITWYLIGLAVVDLIEIFGRKQ